VSGLKEIQSRSFTFVNLRDVAFILAGNTVPGNKKASIEVGPMSIVAGIT
jgi:hypothetical protein